MAAWGLAHARPPPKKTVGTAAGKRRRKVTAESWAPSLSRVPTLSTSAAHDAHSHLPRWTGSLRPANPHPQVSSVFSSCSPPVCAPRNPSLRARARPGVQCAFPFPSPRCPGPMARCLHDQQVVGFEDPWLPWLQWLPWLLWLGISVAQIPLGPVTPWARCVGSTVAAEGARAPELDAAGAALPPPRWGEGGGEGAGRAREKEEEEAGGYGAGRALALPSPALPS